MQNAQDEALLALALECGLLHDAARWRAPDREEGPLAHRLIRDGAIPHQAVASLLRDLAQGSFACAACAERFPYFFLASLPRLGCPSCGGALQHLPNPRPRRRPPLAPTPPTPTPAEQTLVGASARFSRTEPQRVGAYVLLEELGRGATGVVYRARHPVQGEVALKLLHPGLADPESVQRFQSEARIAHRLRHPGIVRVVGAGAVGGRFYCALELVKGETLKDRLEHMGPAPPREASRVLRALCDTLGFAHRHGVIHRDLKPANVLLADPGGTPRVTDFGLARDPSRVSRLTRTGALLGTPAYMAPEQLMGGEVDARADLYALGAILYEVLTGAPPFEAPTVWVLADRVVREAPAPPSQRAPGVPAALEAACLRALAKAPEERFESCEAFAAALERAFTR